MATWIDKMTFSSTQSLNDYRSKGALPVESIISIETLSADQGGAIRVWYYKNDDAAEQQEIGEA